MPLPAPDFAKMFRDGARYPWRADREAVIFLRQAGELLMPSGHVTACDPFLSPELEHAEPFTVTVPPGRYPVELCMVGWTKEGDPGGPATPERVAAAKLIVSREVPVRWEMALVGSQRAEDLADNQFYGYGVDTATGCFMDHGSVSALRELVEEVRPDQFGDNPLYNALEATAWEEPVNLATADGATNIIAFMSGPGDGKYPTWIGYDMTDSPVCFVTDFEFLRRAV
jgi:hypothetical protein